MTKTVMEVASNTGLDEIDAGAFVQLFLDRCYPELIGEFEAFVIELTNHKKLICSVCKTNVLPQDMVEEWCRVCNKHVDI